MGVGLIQDGLIYRDGLMFDNLLFVNSYSSEEENRVEAKRQKKMEKEKHRHHHHHHHHHDRRRGETLQSTRNESTVMTGGYVTKPRQQLREDLAEVKKRKREEKKKAKVEAKIDKLQTKLASVSVGEGTTKKVKVEMEEFKQKGHGK